jgi:competence protein ComEA
LGEIVREQLRWDPGRRGAAAVAVLAVVAVLFTVWQVARSRPQPVSISAAGALGSAMSAVSGGPDGLTAAPPTAATPPIAAPEPSLARASPAIVVVDVAGKVRRPGVYHLRAGARVVDALRAAGGARPHVDTRPLNLAATVSDGEQIVVGGAVAGGPGTVVGPGPAAGSSAAAALVNLNTASLEQLETLPGVGPVLGQNILDWRDAHGRFTSLDQLREVTGIGDVRYGQLQPLVTL